MATTSEPGKLAPDVPLDNIPPHLLPFVKSWRAANEAAIKAYVELKQNAGMKAKLFNKDGEVGGPASGDKSHADKAKDHFDKADKAKNEGKSMEAIKEYQKGADETLKDAGY